MTIELQSDSKQLIIKSVTQLLDDWDGSEPLTMRVDQGMDLIYLVAFTSGKSPTVCESARDLGYGEQI